MRRILSYLATGTVILAGCAGNPGSTEGIPDQTDGRIIITNDEDRLTDRIIIKDDDITVGDGTGKRNIATAFSLKLKAEITPPRVNGALLQATSISLNGQFAYVSYMMRGEPAIGAIDVVQVKGVFNSVIRSSAVFKDTDILSLVYCEGYVYAAEATSDVRYDYPAVLERIGTSGSSKLDLANNLRRMLSSYAATAVAGYKDIIYVTTGNTGGLYKVGATDTLGVRQFTRLDDARWVDTDGSRVVVAQGTPGRLAVFDAASLSPVRVITFDGATIPESKSTVRLIGGKALIAAGDGGVKLIDLGTGALVGSIPRTTVTGLDPSVTVTNAVDATGDRVFISNGEAGVYVAAASQNLENSTGQNPIDLKVLGKLQFAALQSVNHVAYDGTTLAIASGTGGVKLVSITY